ncbi:UDP-N-acetylmuramate dehydrogenase [Desulfosediminicola flagellatus]|uniref:UDP-N-acetylmuramate dehydrogenase n=1 Tax=Desulfosediminicola flagellatus TaxID=2569541 RepID=UPI0010ABE5BA|nr:UDP-N-acetylmuramate dehydrogenase [Desulfosediminicola flagellatus]
MNQLQQLIKSILPSALVSYDEPMEKHTSFRIGGPADVFLTPGSYQELHRCLVVVQEHNLPFFMLGGGTNILVSDRGIRGVVISMARLSGVTISGDSLVAQAGATVENVCNAAAAKSLSGVEFIHGMPGTIGGAVWMNARCYGASIADVLGYATIIDDDLSLTTVLSDPEKFGYKRSPFQTMSGCIFEVSLNLQPGEEHEIRQKMQQNHSDRVDKGHFTAPSAGSLFKNNREFGAPTGRIIDELGLRGAVSGGAAIAPFHGNIFINQDNATATDVLSLIRLAVNTAERERNIRLEPEVRLVGEWNAEELSFLVQ